MLAIIFNGSPMELQEECSLAQAVEIWGYTKGFAVAINQQFIPRSRYDVTTLKKGDDVEILAPMQGG